MKHSNRIFCLLPFIFTVSILTACGGSNAPDNTPGPDSSTENGDRFNPDFYASKEVISDNIYGLWIMAGNEDLAISNSLNGESDSGVGQRRETFALKQGDNLGEIQIRTCGSSQWFTINKGISMLSAFSDNATTYNPDTATKMNVTRSFDISDSDSSTSLSGNYTAYKISNNPNLAVGTMLVTALITNFDTDPISKRFILQNDTVTLYCFSEIISPVATGIPSFVQEQRFDFYYDGISTDENSIFISKVTAAEIGHIVDINHEGENFIAIGGHGTIQINQVENNISTIDINFNADMPVGDLEPDNAFGDIKVNY